MHALRLNGLGRDGCIDRCIVRRASSWWFFFFKQKTAYEIVAILKSFPNLASTPVIAVTAYAMQGDRQRTLVAGCDGYLQKPINVDAFPRQVAEFLGGKRERVEGREEGVYLRELNQRLVYRLLNQVEELKRLNQHFVRRASQLADLHRAVQDITSEPGVAEMLGRLLRGLPQAIGT